MPCVSVAEKDRKLIAGLIIENPKLNASLDILESKINVGDYSFSFDLRSGARDSLLNGTWDPLDELLQAQNTCRKSTPKSCLHIKWSLSHRFLSLSLFGIFFLSGCPLENNKVFHNSDFLLAISEEGLKYQSVPLGSLPKLTTHSDVSGKREAYLIDDIGFILVESEAVIKANLLSDLNNSSVNFINENLILYTHSDNNHEFIEIFQNMKPPLSLNQTGIFKYPLVLCLVLAVFIFTERLYSLRRGLTFPRKVEKALQNGEFPDKRWKNDPQPRE